MSAADSAPTVVRLSGVVVVYATRRGPVQAVDNFDLDVRSGELIALVGPSGCGKTSILRCIAGLMTPTQGLVEIDGRTPREALRRREVALVTQRTTLLPNRTVEKNVRLPLEIARQPDNGAVERALRLVELEKFGKAYPHELSGGMQQRAALARSYVLMPRVLLLDEPFAALDEILRERFAEAFSKTQRAISQTSLFVTHSVEEAVFLADRIVVLSKRPARIVEVIETGLPRERTAPLRETTEFFQVAASVRSTLRKRAYEDGG